VKGFVRYSSDPTMRPARGRKAVLDESMMTGVACACALLMSAQVW